MTPEERWERLNQKTPMPERIRALPFDGRGLPIPHIVFRAPETGKPYFTVNDYLIVLRDCIHRGKCAICGQEMEVSDVWFIGGLGSAYSPVGGYLDPPVHHECGTFALKVCPYLALPSFTGVSNTQSGARYIARLEEEVGPLLVNSTMDPNKPKTFVMAQSTGYMATHCRTSPPIFIPNKPWWQIEHWRDGERIRVVSKDLQDTYRGSELNKFRKKHPQWRWEDSPYFKAAHDSELTGFFPWLELEIS